MALFGLLLPFFFITSNVRMIANSGWLYDYNWWRNGIPQRTGLSIDQLDSAAEQIVTYFNDDEEILDVRVEVRGSEWPLYNEREILHMRDVKSLMRGTFSVSLWTGAFVLAIGALGALLMRGRFWPMLAAATRWSAAASLAAIGVLALASVINFQFVFTQFHLLSFANDLWLLDPRTDYLVVMFPQRFFLEATLMIAVMTGIEFLLLFAAARALRSRYGEAHDPPQHPPLPPDPMPAMGEDEPAADAANTESLRGVGSPQDGQSAFAVDMSMGLSSSNSRGHFRHRYS